MDQTVTKGRVAGSLTAPASKSYAQRAIAAALLARGESKLENLTLCNDVEAALGVAEALGAAITHTDTTYTISGGFNPRLSKLNIGESGLATRLFTPIAALSAAPMTLVGEGSILRRPIAMMEEPLQRLGVEVKTKGGYLPIEVKGPIGGAELTVDGSLSSQFITGLLMALPLSDRDTVMHVNSLKSKPYIDMTLSVAEAFGVSIEHENYDHFFIEGGQTYTPTCYNVEGDWSGASCLLVAGATSGEITITNLNHVSLQADLAIVDALGKAGARVTTTRNSVTVAESPLRAFRFDATHCPDLFPALAALAASCEGTSEIMGTDRLRHKESDRAETIADVFRKMGIEVDLDTPNLMRVTGGAIKSAKVSSHNDHRIAMAAAVAGLRSDGQVVVKHAEAVEKSYPGFWEELRKVTLPAK